MFLSRQVDGLVPGTRYRVDLRSRSPPTCRPAAPVPAAARARASAVKAGATPTRPEKVMGSGSFVTVNFDKGNQSQGGANAVVIGDFAQSAGGGNCLNGPYQRKTLSSGRQRAGGAKRRQWPAVAGRSAPIPGFEGFTELYYLEVRATLTPV